MGGDVDLVIWPEYSFTEDLAHEDAWTRGQLKRVAAGTKIGFIVGATKTHIPQQFSNDSFPYSSTEYHSRSLSVNHDRMATYSTAFLIHPNGNVVGEVPKNKPLVWMEGVPHSVPKNIDVSVMKLQWPWARLRGDGDRGIDTVGSQAHDMSVLFVGIGIGSDAAFQRYARRMASAGADILVFPTYSSQNWSRAHHMQFAEMLRFRAAETGRQVLVSANSGPTLACDRRGVVIGQLDTGVTTTLDVPLLIPRVEHSKNAKKTTTFVSSGWLLGPMCAIVTFGAAIALTAAAVVPAVARLIHQTERPDVRSDATEASSKAVTGSLHRNIIVSDEDWDAKSELEILDKTKPGYDSVNDSDRSNISNHQTKRS